MTIVLLAVPLVIMTVLYGSVIRTLKLGIRQEIAAVDSMDQECKCRNDGAADKFKVLKELSKRENTVHKKSEALQVENTLRSTHIQKSALAKQRVIRMLIVVVIIFFCCWTPSYIWWLLLMAGDSFESLELDLWNSDVNTFITLLTYISSCANPITYCFLNKKFRTAIYTMFGKRKDLRHHFEKVYENTVGADLMTLAFIDSSTVFFCSLVLKSQQSVRQFTFFLHSACSRALLTVMWST
ncbi:unnamed protein product [Angiostrongylus costaricensis]|uniref:G_PROTEIN_RECEP_F1_2 domain-containing protein n=1 Tax=Angiostrongylus costaricensis TaxID=334426 RepID=A0A0R3Q280_ANGCS|nr:unnamed protein product [Angiostrongylus costaricensis]